MYRLSCPELLSRQVLEAMHRQHRKTERRQLRETRQHDIPDWLQPFTEGLVEGASVSSGSAGETIPKKTSSTFSRETLEEKWRETHFYLLIYRRTPIVKIQTHQNHESSMMSETLPESCLPHVGFHDSATVRGSNHTFTSGASDGITSNTCKAQRRLQSWSRRLARAENQTRERLYMGELPDSPDSSVYAFPTNESDEADFD